MSITSSTHTVFSLAAVKTLITQCPLLDKENIKINGQLVVVASNEIKMRFERTYIRGDGQESTYTTEMPAEIIRGLHEWINELYTVWIATEAKMATERANKAVAQAQEMQAEAQKWAHPPAAKRGRKALGKNDDENTVIVD